MSRKIKFRAWIERNKEMITPYFFVNSENFITQYGSSKPSQVMQFTGLKDKNGVEIYEGDIVKGWTHNPCGLHVVEYISDKCNCGFMARQVDGLGKIHIWYDGLEVIGNIHENHELLTTKN